MKQWFWNIFIVLVLLACSPQQEVQTPAEQLPSPEFKTKPQIYMVFNVGLIPFSSPSGEELSAKLNYNVTVASVSSTQELRTHVRDFNARPADILFVGPSLLGSEVLLKSLAHPTRKASFILDLDERAQEFPSRKTVLLDLHRIERTAKTLCELVSTELGLKCQSAVGLKAADAAKIPIGKNTVEVSWAGSAQIPTSPNALFVLSVNWESWLRQVMLQLSKGETPAGSLLELSFSNGTVSLEINRALDHSRFASLDLKKAEKLLFDFKMKALQDD